MGWSIFIEEPGDHQLSVPYGVLAGIVIEDRFVWQLARKLKDAEIQFFGCPLEQLSSHFTIDTILAPEVLQLAKSVPMMSAPSRLDLVKAHFVEVDVENALQHSTALAQSCVAFCHHVIASLRSFQAGAVAIMIPSEDISFSYEMQLRKDYAFLFERVAYFLAEKSADTVGLMILDDTRHTGKHVSIDTITGYFERTTKGRLRAQQLIPEPVFAGPSLAAINRAAVLFSYIVGWNFRLSTMNRPVRADLSDFIKQCIGMRYSYISETGIKDWSFKFVESVRASQEVSAPIRRS